MEHSGGIWRCGGGAGQESILITVTVSFIDGQILLGRAIPQEVSFSTCASSMDTDLPG